MDDQQQFCLRWNDFQTNMVASFKHLRDIVPNRQDLCLAAREIILILTRIDCLRTCLYLFCSMGIIFFRKKSVFWINGWLLNHTACYFVKGVRFDIKFRMLESLKMYRTCTPYPMNIWLLSPFHCLLNIVNFDFCSQWSSRQQSILLRFFKLNIFFWNKHNN